MSDAEFRCKLCHATRVERRYPLRFGRPFEAVVCASCGLFQVLYDWSRVPAVRETTAYDQPSSVWASEKENEAFAAKATMFADKLAADGLLRGARVLDIGAGRGYFLKACLDRGAAHVTGQEFRNVDIRHAREDLGITDVRSVLLSDRATWPDGEFDLVCSFDVIEHVHDLDAFLRDSLRVLRPGGTMFHATPGFDSISHFVGRASSRLGARGLAGTLCNVEYPVDMLGGPHVHILGRRQAEWFAARNGLDVRCEYVSSFTYSDDHYAAIVSPINRLPRPVGRALFGLVRRTVRNKLVLTARRPAAPVAATA